MSNISNIKKFLLGLYFNSVYNINLDELKSSGYIISKGKINRLIDEGIILSGGNNIFYITINELQKKSIISSMNKEEFFYYLKLTDNYIQNTSELNSRLVKRGI